MRGDAGKVSTCSVVVVTVSVAGVAWVASNAVGALEDLVKKLPKSVAHPDKINEIKRNNTGRVDFKITIR